MSITTRKTPSASWRRWQAGFAADRTRSIPFVSYELEPGDDVHCDGSPDRPEAHRIVQVFALASRHRPLRPARIGSPRLPSDLGDDHVDLGKRAAKHRVHVSPWVWRHFGAFSSGAHSVARRRHRLYIVAPAEATPPVAVFCDHHGSLCRAALGLVASLWVLAKALH